MLRAVPRHLKIPLFGKKFKDTDVLSHLEDPLSQFLHNSDNRDKYYYVRRGNAGPGQDPRLNNTLEPLGHFTKIERYNLHGSNIDDGYVHYNIEFEIPPSTRISENDELYYTDEPPAAGSVPLTINDIPASSGGKKTKKYRKNKKKYRTIKNKKRRFRVLKKK